MKLTNRFFYCIVLIFIIVITASCSSEIKNIEEDEAVSTLADNDVIKISENDILPQDKNEYKEITYFNNAVILYDINYGIDDVEHYDYYTQNIITGEKKAVPSLADYFPASRISLGNNKAVIALQNISSDKSRSKRFTLNLLDLSNETNTLLTQWDDFYYVAGLQKLDNDTIMMFRPTDTETGYEYLFQTMNIQTKELKDFLTTEYNKAENVGDVANTYCIDSEKIYIYSTHYNKDDIPKQSIFVYNRNGDLLKEYNFDLNEQLDSIKSYFNDNNVRDTVTQIYKYGDNILLRTQHRLYYLFKESDDGLTEIDLPDELKQPLNFYLASNNLNADTGIIYFYDSDKTIIVFDTNTLTTLRIDLEFPEGYEKYRIDTMYIDDSGKVLISIDNLHEDAKGMNKFVILSNEDFS